MDRFLLLTQLKNEMPKVRKSFGPDRPRALQYAARVLARWWIVNAPTADAARAIVFPDGWTNTARGPLEDLRIVATGCGGGRLASLKGAKQA